MSEVININSTKGLVKFSREDLISLDLIKWVRSSYKGVGTQRLLSDTPFERSAAFAYKEKYPSQVIKMAEKCILDDDGSVSVVLRIAEEVARGLYNEHPTKTIFSKQEKSKL